MNVVQLMTGILICKIFMSASEILVYTKFDTRITSTEEDFKGRTSRLRSALVGWEDVAHSYVASFGEVKKKRPTIDRRQLDVFGLPLFTTPPMMTTYPEIIDRKITNTDPIIIDFRTPKGKKQSMFKSPL